MSARSLRYGLGFVIAFASVACTQQTTAARRVTLESAKAAYKDERPDGRPWDAGISPWPEVEARFLVDGKQVGACTKRWFESEVACRFEDEVDVREDSRFELLVEDRDDATVERIGAGTFERVGESYRRAAM